MIEQVPFRYTGYACEDGYVYFLGSFEEFHYQVDVLPEDIDLLEGEMLVIGFSYYLEQFKKFRATLTHGDGGSVIHLQGTSTLKGRDYE